MAFNPFILQDTMNPEAVQPCFLNDHDREQFPSPRKSLLVETENYLSSVQTSLAGTLCFVPVKTAEMVRELYETHLCAANRKGRKYVKERPRRRHGCGC